MRLVILGGGESGVGTAILGLKQGYDVFVSDFGTIAPNYKASLEKYGIKWEENQHTEAEILNADVVMKSPGIPDTVPLVQKLNKNGVEVISEIEFAAQFTDAKIVAITGSNGKTTTTLLTHHVLKSAGLHVGIAGNIGKSFAQQVAEENFDYYVLEISSFQLDGIKKFKPHIAIITNISPDHLDRYEYKFENYINSKFRITMNQDTNDFLIYDNDDAVISSWLGVNTIQANKTPFSLEKELVKGSFVANKNIKNNLKKDEFEMPLEELSIQGKHNIKNAMAATSVAQLLNIRKQTIRESLANFQGVPHRLEKVLKIEGVQYINDSKATNVNATFFALDSMTQSTVWIVGGVDKGNDYTELFSLVREKVKAIVCLGVDNKKIIQHFEGLVDYIYESASMDEAVKTASKLAETGDAVLLAPACASFDLFKNYEDRGNQFKEAVGKL